MQPALAALDPNRRDAVVAPIEDALPFASYSTEEAVGNQRTIDFAPCNAKILLLQIDRRFIRARGESTSLVLVDMLAQQGLAVAARTAVHHEIQFLAVQPQVSKIVIRYDPFDGLEFSKVV